MECREVRSLVDAFVSEQLLVETTQAIVAHLARCPACRAEVEGLRRLRLATRFAFEASTHLEPRSEFVVALGARLQAETSRQQPKEPSRPLWLSIAASVLLLVGVGFGVREWAASSVTALLHAAVGDHRFCALTFKLAEQPISLEEAAGRYGAFNERLATVEPTRTTLSGGPLRIVARHSCVFDGQRFAHLVLRYKNETVSLLVAENGQPGTALSNRTPAIDIALPVTDGFHVASFRGSRHIVFVVSSLSDTDVHEVAQAMAGPVSQALTGAS